MKYIPCIGHIEFPVYSLYWKIFEKKQKDGPPNGYHVLLS